MRRAATSLTNNIAEGDGRYHYQENIQFCRQSRGSLSELIDDLNVCLDQGYFPVDYLSGLKQQAYDLNKRLNGYIAYLRRRKDSDSEKLIS
jgi:four helix bundle protein